MLRYRWTIARPTSAIPRTNLSLKNLKQAPLLSILRKSKSQTRISRIGEIIFSETIKVMDKSQKEIAFATTCIRRLCWVRGRGCSSNLTLARSQYCQCSQYVWTSRSLRETHYFVNIRWVRIKGFAPWLRKINLLTVFRGPKAQSGGGLFWRNLRDSHSNGYWRKRSHHSGCNGPSNRGCCRGVVELPD